MEISRWFKPPVTDHEKNISPEGAAEPASKQRRNPTPKASGINFRRPDRGLICCHCIFRRFAPPANLGSSLRDYNVAALLSPAIVVPMNIQERIDSDLKEAMRAKDTTKLAVLRMLKSALKYAAIAKSGAEAELSDAEAIQVIRKQSKQRQDSIDSFEKGGRADLAKKEQEELSILNAYMPKAMSADEVEQAVREAIAEAGATSKAQMGAVMKAVQAKVAGRVDGKTLSQEVSRQLS